jgi:lipopolysaccharide transport system ATP-binding protein
MTAIQSLCERVIWLNEGRIEMDGEANNVISSYVISGAANQTERIWLDRDTAPGNELVRVVAARVYPEKGTPQDEITIRTPCIVEFDYWNNQPGLRLNLSVVLKNQQGIEVFNTYPADEPEWHGKEFPVGLFRSSFHIPGDLLNDGFHTADLYVVRNQNTVIFRKDDILSFDVADSPDMRGNWHGKVIGAVRPVLKWTTKLIRKEPPQSATQR